MTNSNTSAARQWSMTDRISYGGAIAGSVLMLGISACNVVAVLVAAQLPVFLDAPWLAWSIAMLAPAFGLAIKFGISLLDVYKHRRLYMRGVFALALASFGLWVVLFAINFPGLNGSLTLDTLTGGNAKGSALVLVQLIAEVSTGAALFLLAGDIAAKYSPDYFRENLSYLNAKQDLDEHEARLQRLADERADAHSRLIQLEAARQVFIDEKVAAYLAARARFTALNNFQ